MGNSQQTREGMEDMQTKEFEDKRDIREIEDKVELVDYLIERLKIDVEVSKLKFDKVNINEFDEFDGDQIDEINHKIDFHSHSKKNVESASINSNNSLIEDTQEIKALDDTSQSIYVHKKPMNIEKKAAILQRILFEMGFRRIEKIGGAKRIKIIKKKYKEYDSALKGIEKIQKSKLRVLYKLFIKSNQKLKEEKEEYELMIKAFTLFISEEMNKDSSSSSESEKK
jgi:hypothetical protein